MKDREYAIEMAKDRSLSETEVANRSGLLATARAEDVPGILYSIAILRNADEKYQREVNRAVSCL